MKIAVLYPELLGTYGDGGNALVLAHRAQLRGVAAQIVQVRLSDKIVDADIYLLGGGEDGPQQLATEALRSGGELASRIANGAQLLAVCAGYQILGRRFAVAGGRDHDGLGLIDVVTTRGEPRRVGEMMTTVGARRLVGFENHGGVSTLGSSHSLGSVTHGYGNDGRTDGAREPGIFATYAHGPVTALNPWFADEILAATLGVELEPVETIADRLYQERCERVAQAGSRRP